MDKELKALLDKLADLSHEDRQDFLAKLVARKDEISSGELTDEAVTELGEIVDGILAVEALNEAHEQAVSDRAAKAAELLKKVEKPEAPKAEDKPEEVEPEVTPEPEKETVDAEKDKLQVLEPVAASVTLPTVTEVAGRRPEAQAPRIEPNPTVSITAAADLPGFSSGHEFSGPREIGNAFMEKVNSLMRGANLAPKYPVARVRVDYPEELQLTQGHMERNSERVNNAAGPEALVASGGLCAPVAASYALMNLSRATRPIRNSLPTFNAERGGIRFITPPVLTDLADGVGIWTEANDTTPTDPETKPCVTITCGTEVTVAIDAITLCIKVGNFSRMTFPEQFQTWYDLGLAMHARVAEGNLLDKISDASTDVADTVPQLGASRDLPEMYGRLGSQYRNRHRMDPQANLSVLLPYVALEAMRSDVLRQLPGDGMETRKVADAEINSWFGARNLNVTWYEDTRTGGGQVYGAQGDGFPLPYVNPVEGYLFAPGSFLFLDGGVLDLGVNIRDSTLISTNDVEAFMETFEAVAFTGIESLRVRTNICVDGSSGATKEVDCIGS